MSGQVCYNGYHCRQILKKGDKKMIHDDLYGYCELQSIAAATEALGKSKDFIVFLHYCAARLEKGEQVQEVWCDYQSKGQRILP